MKDERGKRLYEIRCRECGKMFAATSLNRNFCSDECRQAVRERRHGIKEVPESEKPKKTRKSRKNAGLDADIRAARETGVSYGQYMALYKEKTMRR